MGVTSGKVRRIVADKGFGFIKTNGGEEYFFHRSAVESGEFESLRENDDVTFHATEGPKGLRAESVRLAL